VWNEQEYTAETQAYVRELMVKFGLAVEDPTTVGDLIIPCLARKVFYIKNVTEMKRWEYTMTSMTPPLGLSSTVTVRLLQHGTKPGEVATWEVYRDGCSLMLQKLNVCIHIKPSSIEVYVDIEQEDSDDRMARVMVEVVSEIRLTQRALVKSTEAKGYMKGQCFRCNEVTTITEDLEKMVSRYSQFCCYRCRKLLGLIDAHSLTRSLSDIQLN